MRFYGKAVLTGLLLLSGAAAQQNPPPPAEGSVPLYKSETRLVPVDVVVQDKKGNYVHDLERKDFKVWEDNKEQAVRNFSFEADPASPLAQQKKYLVLFFDLSSMNSGDQIQARQAAAKFVDANAGPNRLMAVVNFGGGLQIAQNFTDDIERLKQVVTAVKMGMVVSNNGIGGPGGGGGGPRLGGMSQFGQRTMLLALRSLAASLGEVPGRKTLVLFSSGFPMNPQTEPEITAEATAAIDSCNRSNVAVYPVDVRGLVGNTMPSGNTRPFGPGRGAVTLPGSAARDAGLALAAFPVLRIATWIAAYDPQRGAGGGGGSSGGSSGGTSGGTGSSGSSGGGSKSGSGSGGGLPSGGSSGAGTSRGTSGSGSSGGGTRSGGTTTTGGGGGGGTPNPNGTRMNRSLDPNNTRGIMGRFPDSATTNQQILYMLADGTGGFVIVNTNDLLGGLQKINKEQNEYYLLAYSPPESDEGSCHTIKVKVSRGGLNVRARTGYCNVKSADLLAGTPAEKQMETVAQGTQPGTISAPPMQIPFFYTGANTAAVHVAMEIPTAQVKFEKVKGKEHAEVSVMGIAYRPDGNVAAKFSDSVKIDLENKKAVEEFASKPLHYENQFDIGSGDYTLKVVFTSGGAGFGKLESPLKVEPYDPQQFAMSALAMSAQIRPLNGQSNINSELVEGKTPLTVAIPNGMFQVIPAGAARFHAGDKVVVYYEVYEPLAQQPEAATLVMRSQMRILDNAGAEKMNSGGMDIAGFMKAGQPVVPVALQIPPGALTPGRYKLEVKTVDSAGKGVTRTADFEIVG